MKGLCYLKETAVKEKQKQRYDLLLPFPSSSGLIIMFWYFRETNELQVPSNPLMNSLSPLSLSCDTKTGTTAFTSAFLYCESGCADSDRLTHLSNGNSTSGVSFTMHTNLHICMCILVHTQVKHTHMRIPPVYHHNRAVCTFWFNKHTMHRLMWRWKKGCAVAFHVLTSLQTGAIWASVLPCIK